MKKGIFTVLALLCAVTGFSQTGTTGFIAPDYGKIREAVSDPGSDLYYPRLKERMERLDPTLTLSQMRALYYGSVFQPGFSWFTFSEKETVVNEFYDYQRIPLRKYDAIIKAVDEVLETNPFYLKGLNLKARILRLQGEEEQARRTAGWVGKVVETILSSGDGGSTETAYHVVDVAHEYFLFNFLGFSCRRTQSHRIEGNMCDRFVSEEGGELFFFVPYACMPEAMTF